MAFIELTRNGRPLYRVRWNYRDPSIDGRPYDQREFRNRAEAVAWHRSVSRDHITAPGIARVSHIAQVYLERHVATLELSTQADYEQAIRMRINPGLGTKVADRLTARDTTAWLRVLTTKGYPHTDHLGRRQPAKYTSVPTANKTLRIAKAMMRWARAEGLTTCRAFEDTRSLRDRRPREERRSRARAYTPAELDRLVASCQRLMEATIILVGADSGLRRSELFALCWDCVDLEEGEIHVRRALDRRGGFKDPKTHERRTVPLLDDGLDALRHWRQHAPPTDLVFPAADGRPLHTTWDSGHQPAIRERSGIHLQLNELRDTYASTIITSGASDVEVTMAVGHKSVQTTRDHYFEWFEPSRNSLRARANAVRRQQRALQGG